MRRVDALFQAMSHDFLLRQQFITNPVHALSEYVYGTQISSERASVSNQLIYAVLSDRELLTWLHFYASEHRDNVPSGVEFVKDFAHAIVDHGGHHTVMALIRSSAEGNSLVGFDEDLLHFFFNLGALVGASEMEARGEAANIDSPSQEATDAAAASTSTNNPPTVLIPAVPDPAPPAERTGFRDPGAADGTCTAITWQTWLITKPQADLDDRFSAGQPSEFGPRYVMVTLDELAIYAAGLRRSGALELHFSTP